MRKKNGLLFVGILAVLLLLGSLLLDPACLGSVRLVPERYKAASQLLKEEEDAFDVLVAGDSLSYSSVSPVKLWEERGITSFDCGQSGQRLPETYYMLKKTLKKQSPKVILLETNLLFRYHGILEELSYSISEAGGYYIPFFRYHNFWKKLPAAGQKEDQESYKGFSFRIDVTPYTGGGYKEKKGKKDVISSYARYYLKSIQKLCEKSGVRLVLFSAPSPKNYNARRIQALEEFAGELQLSYLNLNDHLEETGIDWEKDTLDKGDHLNIYGAQKISAYLAGYLQDTFGLEDHRGESIAAEWEELVIRYEEELEALDHPAEEENQNGQAPENA